MKFIAWVWGFIKKNVGKILRYLEFGLVIKQKFLIRKLRAKHKQLTREVTENLLDNQKVTQAEQTRLQLIDNLIIHNVAIMFNRLLWYILIPLGLLMIFLCVWHSSEVPVALNVRATSVMWKIATAEPGTKGTADWNMFANDNSVHTTKSILDPGKNSVTDADEHNLVLIPCVKNNPIEICNLTLPEKCYMGINFADSLTASIVYEWRETISQSPLISWDITFQHRKIQYGDKLLVDTCLVNKTTLNIQKKLKPGAVYDLPLEGLHKWQLQRPLRVSELSFNVDPGLPQSRSSIISGKINLMNIAGKDSVISLNEGDRVRLTFKEPVDLYLSTEPGYVNIRTGGIVTSLECEPEALNQSIDKMPLALKSFTDESPYLLTLIAIIVPMLMAMLVRQRKSI